MTGTARTSSLTGRVSRLSQFLTSPVRLPRLITRHPQHTVGEAVPTRQAFEQMEGC